MKSNFKYFIDFLLLIAFQVIVLNNLELGGLINPYLYIMFIIMLPTRINRYLLLLLGFILGATIDVLSNTYGINAAATVFIAFMRPYIMKILLSEEEREKPAPTLYALGGASFFKYISFTVIIHHFMLFMLEAFSFSYILPVLEKTALSSLVTILLIWGLESFGKRK